MITARHIEELEGMQRAFLFSASIEKETAFRAAYIEKAVLIGEIRDYMLETLLEKKGTREARKNVGTAAPTSELPV